MPQIFKIGSFWVYFWSNEGVPLEPVHVHVSEGMPAANATKIWITRARKCLLANSGKPVGNPDRFKSRDSTRSFMLIVLKYE